MFNKMNNSNKLGIIKINGKATTPIHIAIKLFIRSMVKTEFFSERVLMQMISKPMIIAPKRQSKAMGSTLKSTVGRIKSRPPEKEIRAPDQRMEPIFSLKMNAAKTIAKMGLRNVKAVASLTGIYRIDVNRIDTPIQPKMDRNRWSLMFEYFILGLKKIQIQVIKINEKKNLACAI